jgi:hypothetical protein
MEKKEWRPTMMMMIMLIVKVLIVKAKDMVSLFRVDVLVG